MKKNPGRTSGKKATAAKRSKKAKKAGGMVVRTLDAAGATGAWVFTPAFLDAAGGRQLVFDIVRGVARVSDHGNYGAGCRDVFTAILELEPEE